MLAMGAQLAAAQLRALAAGGGGSGGRGSDSQQPAELLHLVFHREVTLDVPPDKARSACACMQMLFESMHGVPSSAAPPHMACHESVAAVAGPPCSSAG
jgi:hypothetical protein